MLEPSAQHKVEKSEVQGNADKTDRESGKTVSEGRPEKTTRPGDEERKTVETWKLKTAPMEQGDAQDMDAPTHCHTGRGEGLREVQKCTRTAHRAGQG